MHTKVGATPAYVLSQFSTAIAGAACIIASIAVGNSLIDSAKTALFQPVYLNSSLTNLSSLQMDVIHGTRFDGVEKIPALETLVQTDVDAGLQKIAQLEKISKHERVKTRHHLDATLVATYNDEIRRIQAAEIAAAPELQQEEIPAPEMTEAERLQQVSLLLTHRFRVSLAPVREELNTQVAEAVSIQPEKHSDLGLDGIPEVSKPGKSGKPKQVLAAVAVDTQDKKTAEEEEIPAPEVTEKTQKDSIQISASAEVASPQDQLQEKLIDQVVKSVNGDSNFAVPTEGQEQGSTEVGENIQQHTQTPMDTPPAKAAPTLKSEQVNILGTTFVLPEYPKDLKPAQPLAEAKPVGMATQPSSNVTTQVDAQKKTENLMSAIFGAALAPKAVTQVAVNTPPAQPQQPVVPKSLLKPAAHFDEELDAPQPPAPSIQTNFVEAFDWTRAVSDAQAEVMTREDGADLQGVRSPSQVGWRIARASDHWPTVYWNRVEDTPLLSKNTARMLSLKSGAELQNEAGIVIAKAPAGWNLEFSGRAEHPLVFTRSNQWVSPSAVDEDRYYIFLNVSPGEGILYLLKDGKTGAIALPVFGGMVSYADLSAPGKSTISGKIVDTAGTVRALAGLKVQIIGSGQTTVTNGTGVFQFENAVTFGSQPIFVEAEGSQGYPQRYKVRPTDAPKTFYFMTEEQIHEWLGQLDGGVSSESGLVIAALPGVAALSETQNATARIRSLAVDPTLTPETYTISSIGQLQIKTPLAPTNARVLGVQVSDGPAIVEVTGKDGLIWSELVVISPRVLSVIGPY